jgi:KDO2-lipid IV(A) lauroyltransferase
MDFGDRPALYADLIPISLISGDRCRGSGTPASITFMQRILYYFLLLPFSKLPPGILYGLADALHFLVYQIAGYRKKVVLANLSRAFPSWDNHRIKVVAGKFYRHLADLLVENICSWSMDATAARQHLQVVNPELLDRYHDQGKSVIIVIGHYNNWEWIAAMLPLWVKHRTIALYAPLSNRFFEKKLKAARSRFGTELIPKGDAVRFFADNKTRPPFAIVFAADQSPTFSKQVHWTTFLHQETAVMLGAERFGQRYDYPVVFGYAEKTGRGRYILRFELVAEHPAQSPNGEVTERHTRMLEDQILAAPQYWLWTHRRWKRRRG